MRHNEEYKHASGMLRMMNAKHAHLDRGDEWAYDTYKWIKRRNLLRKCEILVEQDRLDRH